MSTTLILIVARLLVAGIFAGGAVWLAGMGKEGWGWCVFAALALGCVTISEVKD